VRADIDKITAPVLLFRSSTDHVVEASNAAWILGHVRSTDVEERLLPRSYHVATLDYDAPDIFAGSVEFIRKHAPAAAG
jgi:carboxylesterase